MKHLKKDSNKKGKIMAESILEKRIRVKERIIVGLDKGAKIEIVFTGDSRIRGVVEDVELCTNLNMENWHKVYLNVAGKRFEYDSRTDSDIVRCVMPKEDDVIICKNMFEIYNIPFGLSDNEFLKAVIENWNGYEINQKEEIARSIACSINGDILKDILDAYVFMQKCHDEDSTKVIKLIDEKAEEVEERIKVVKEKKELEEKYEKLSEAYKGALAVYTLASLMSDGLKCIGNKKDE